MKATIDSCNLLVQIIGAKNIPLRSDFDQPNSVSAKHKSPQKKKLPNRYGDFASEQDSLLDEQQEGAHSPSNYRSSSNNKNVVRIVSEALLDEIKITEKKRARTFVEVQFQERKARTAVYEGMFDKKICIN
jgi:hypothetical protein